MTGEEEEEDTTRSCGMANSFNPVKDMAAALVSCSCMCCAHARATVPIVASRGVSLGPRNFNVRATHPGNHKAASENDACTLLGQYQDCTGCCCGCL